MNNNPKDSKNIKLKPIKLIVKKPTTARKENIDNNSKKNEIELNKIIREQQIIELFSSLKVLLLIILLICIITLLINITKEQKKTIEEKSNINTLENNQGLYSIWQTSNGYTFTFENNNIFHIYESGLYVHNNYYEGSFDYNEGSEAISEMGYTDEEFKNDYNLESYLNLYSIHMVPTKYMKNNNNIISRKIEKGEKWWFILIIIDNNKAIAYNKTLDIRYQLIRN